MKHNDDLEVVITCMNYSDFLEQTLPFTVPHVNRVVVVTDFEDAETKNICKKWSVECIPTDVHRERNNSFNKGEAINVGLAMLRQNGWVLHLDADVVLPHTFRNMLSKSDLDENSIYGANRMNIRSWEDWQNLKSNWFNEPQFKYSCLLNTPDEHPLGATLIHKQFGYIPIGYFQLWHSSYTEKHELRYPSVQSSAAHVDVQWAIRWPRKNRILLPTVRVFHLESEKSEMGVNWNGRKTKKFQSNKCTYNNF